LSTRSQSDTRQQASNVPLSSTSRTTKYAASGTLPKTGENTGVSSIMSVIGTILGLFGITVITKRRKHNAER
ncbi:MAG: LPXTG cell wall anchor domain-containing protein, partial [Enterococcus hulanensis]